MQPWIDQLTEVAVERNPGKPDAFWGSGEIPEELAALYEAMDGALLPGDVRFFESAALSARGLGPLQFGRKGEAQRLLAVRRGEVYSLAGQGVVPAWIEALEPDAWVFALAGEPDALRLYRTLERMLEVIVPPRVKEDFGEHTFARALHAVQDALGALRPSAPTPEPEAPRAGKAKKKKKVTPSKRSERSRPVRVTAKPSKGAKKGPTSAANRKRASPAKGKPVARRTAAGKPSRGGKARKAPPRRPRR